MQLVPKKNKAESPLLTKNKITLDVEGMQCAGCVKAVEKQLTQFPGVDKASVNLATGVAVVDSEKFDIDIDALVKELTTAGFPSKPRKPPGETDTAQALKEAEDKKRKEMQSAKQQLIIAVMLLLFSGIGHLGNIGGLMLPVLQNIWFHFGLATVAIIIPGRPILIDGWLGLRRNAPNMNTLVALGTLSAYTASVVALFFPQLGWECFFDEPVMILGFILLGRTLEKQARNRASAAFQELLSLKPSIARLIAKSNTDNAQKAEIIEIPAEQVHIGEWLQVLPGDKIPVDGEVIEGKTTVDESMLTGESAPVAKKVGDSLSAGTINQLGTITIQATRTGNDTTVAQIVGLVEAAQIRKAPVQKLADTVAGYFTYGVLTTALLTFLFWYFIGTNIWHDIVTSTVLLPSPHSQHFSGYLTQQTPTYYSPILISLKLAIAVMVVACPCALGLATPTAILVGTAIGAERGLLIKGGDVLEKVHQLKTIVFDKTGTLTTGSPSVTDCIPISDKHTVNSLIQLAAAVESGSQHPLAKAILDSAAERELPIPPATDFHTEPGFGLSAVVEGNRIFLGSWEWLNLNNISINQTLQKQLKAFAEAGKTVVGVANESEIIGLIAVQDTIREDAFSTVEKLHSLGLRVMLLSGDTQEAALATAKQLGLDTNDAIAGIPPAKKAAVIQSLQNSQPQSLVAMVGDGINDAPALSQADVGISLHSGTDVAMEAAEIVLMRDKLKDVVEAIALSRATFNKIRQNLFWAFAYNIIGIPLAAGVLLPSLGFILNPGGAAALMAFSSVSVVTNSLLLRRFALNS
ncbi:heavy metal translocating P-type ATPase [Rivularia sp. PCC 7116]|uniref:heavy metal translocating P-type ATPase n=1 Tax=Rivularia sp. PCC 7116 TaxID=373994 RepID=UPI00029F323D|nr:heavy metal translocating P-type ATPase [Rivularia sp. PCC 7116]AFY59195.1 heavy metal translocating P-type ATPase [Rivularia sp. PCC 7116]